MISIEECKKYLGDLNLSDQKIGEIRDALYVVVENVLDKYTQSGILCPVGKNKESRQNVKDKEIWKN